MVIIGFIVLGWSYAYISFSHPSFLQKQKPAVLVIDIEGEIISSRFGGIYEKRGKERPVVTSAENVVRMLDYFSEDDSIKAFLLEIDAYEGQNAGQEEIVRQIRRMNKPVIAVIKGSALSAGYYVAAGSDKLYAHKSAKIGNIANTFVEVNRTRKGSEQECIILPSKYKNTSVKDCAGFDAAEFDKLKHFVDITHSTLLSHIGEMRSIPTPSLQHIASDKILNSSEALSYKLIDEIGTTYDAIVWLEKELGIKLWIVYLRDMIPPEQRER